jgi:hypothetical protein
MAADIIPQSFQNLHDWVTNMRAKISAQGKQLQMAESQIAEFDQLLQRVGHGVEAQLAAQAALDEATAGLFQTISRELPKVRRVLKKIKSSAGYNYGVGAELGLLAGNGSFDPHSYQPVLQAKVFPGFVRLTGRKLGAEAFNLYARREGENSFRKIASNRSRFPFDDDAPLAENGARETREYQAAGMVGNREIGQPSKIIRVVYDPSQFVR